MSKCFQAKTNEVMQNWFIVDAEGKILGRLASQISRVLTGKHKPEYTPHIDCGDFVVVINAAKIKVTGKKAEYSKYEFYSGYPSGLKTVTFKRMLERKPTEILRLAVKRMMPKSKMGRKMLTKLKIYAADEHPHSAQNPEPFPFNKI